MMWRLVCLCLLSLAGASLLAAGAPFFLTGCTFTVYEKELVVGPPGDEASPWSGEAPLRTLAALPSEVSWMQFLDFNHIVDSIVELFKHTTAKEAIRHGMHYTERKRFLHFELGRQRDETSEDSQRGSPGDSQGESP